MRRHERGAERQFGRLAPTPIVTLRKPAGEAPWDIWARTLPFEYGAAETALANDRQQGPDLQFGMIGDGNRNGGGFGSALHDGVTPALTHARKSMLFQDAADLRT